MTLLRSVFSGSRVAIRRRKDAARQFSRELCADSQDGAPPSNKLGEDGRTVTRERTARTTFVSTKQLLTRLAKLRQFDAYESAVSRQRAYAAARHDLVLIVIVVFPRCIAWCRVVGDGEMFVCLETLSPITAEYDRIVGQ